jgi:tryptophanyl-tRNA synthetase
MSKSYNNAIGLRDDPDEIRQRIQTMPTDPARVQRSDPGDPEKCPVWAFHLLYSNDETKAWVQNGCRTAAFGCLECKRKVIDAVIAELDPIRERASEYAHDPTLVRNIIAEGCERAQDVAEETLVDVRQVMGLGYG